MALVIQTPSQAKAKKIYDAAETHSFFTDMDGKGFEGRILKYMNEEKLSYMNAVMKATQWVTNQVTDNATQQGVQVINVNIDTAEYDLKRTFYMEVQIIVILPKGVDTYYPYSFHE
jgi:hypothetical protein